MIERKNDDAPRRYSDREVRQLLERATRADHGVPAPGPRAHGLTLAELEEVAAEAHIDVGRLRDAARELEATNATRPSTPAAHLAGAPLRNHVERTLPFEADDQALQALVMSMGSLTGGRGEPRFVGRTFTWTASTNSGRHLEVQVSVQRGSTTIRLVERYGELAGGLFGGVIGGVGGGVGIGGGTAVASALGSVALGVAIPVAVVAGSYAACRFGYAAYVRHRARTLEELCDRIAQDLTASHEDEFPADSDPE